MPATSVATITYTLTHSITFMSDTLLNVMRDVIRENGLSPDKLMNDGETLSGVVADETGTSITLKMSGGSTRVLSRQNVKRVAGSQVSLMPENLEAGISPAQMADLIAFLHTDPAKPVVR